LFLVKVGIVNSMHAKQKGNIAQSSVVVELQMNGFNVFSELGDLSKIDLIAEFNGVLARIQVKYVSGAEDCAILPLRKSGPNGYRYTYTSSDVDWFAIFHAPTKSICYVPSREACERASAFNVRMLPSANGQSKGVNLYEDYDIKRFLRDFTQHTDLLSGEDKVQTTTSEGGLGNQE
jgi:hypothetical protein